MMCCLPTQLPEYGSLLGQIPDSFCARWYMDRKLLLRHPEISTVVGLDQTGYHVKLVVFPGSVWSQRPTILPWCME